MKPKILAGTAFLALAALLVAPALHHKAAAAQRSVPKFEPDPY